MNDYPTGDYFSSVDNFSSDYANSGLFQSSNDYQQQANPALNDIQRNGFNYHFEGTGGNGVRGGNGNFGGLNESFGDHNNLISQQMYGGLGGNGSMGSMNNGGCATGNCGTQNWNNYDQGHGGYANDYPMQQGHGGGSGHQHQGVDPEAVKKAWAHYLQKKEAEENSKGWKGKYDLPSVGINLAAIGVWIWIWSSFGLNKSQDMFANFIFYAVIAVFVVSAAMSGQKTDKYDKEMKSLGGVEKSLILLAQISLGMSLFVTALKSYFNIDPAQRTLIFTAFTLSFIMSFIGLLFVSFPKKNTYVRTYRKIKGVLLNMAIGLMIFGMMNASKSLMKRRPTLAL